MNRLVYTLIILFAFSCNKLSAADKVIACNNCSVASHDWRADEAAPRYAESTMVHIFDETRKTLHSYEVVRDFEAGPFVTTFVIPAGTPDDINIKYLNYVSALNTFESLKSLIDEVPSDIASSAWDMAYDPIARQRVGDWIQSNQPVYSSLISVVNLATGFFGVPAITLSIEFADGSVAKFKYKSLDSAGNIYYEFVPEESRDADGNNLEFAGTNSFAGTGHSGLSLSDFLAAAARAGIPIIVNGGPMGGVPVRCVKVGDKIKCTPINDPH